MNPIDKNDEVNMQKIKEYKPALEKLLSKANKMWDLKCLL
jgi:hypothetical protein